MSNRKSSVFYGILIAFAFTAMGMVLASRFGLTPTSNAGPINIPATNSAPLTGTIDATTFRTIAKAENPAVVSITAYSQHRAGPDVSEMFQFPGLQQPAPRRRGGQPQQPETMAAGGSGFIIDKANGFILTNNHVIDGANDIRVRFFDNDPINDPEGQQAKLIGRDVLTDSALIQLVGTAPSNTTQVRFGDSAQLDAGDWVMAIGNPFSYSNTVTVGVVSAVSRVNPQLNPVQGRDLEYIQTDAAINHGNSGGPLLNVRGEVIGINTAIISDGETGGNLGIGFAVPINTVRDILPSLKTGKVSRGRIGVSVDKHKIDSRDIKELGLTDAAGAQITLIVPGGPAAKAGVKPGDIVTEFNGKPVKDSNALVEMVVHTAPGTTVPMRLVRNGKPQSLNITIEELNVDDEIAPAAEPKEVTPDAAPEPKETGFGMTVEPLTPQITRHLSVPSGQGGAIVADMDPRGEAALSGMAPTDVILTVNNTPVSSPDQVIKALDEIPSGHIARVLVWRTIQGQRGEQMVTMRKK
jgi:serine protease Do